MSRSRREQAKATGLAEISVQPEVTEVAEESTILAAIQGLRSELDSKLIDLRQDLRRDLNKDLDSKLQTLREDLERQIGSFESNLSLYSDRVTALEQDNTKLRSEVDMMRKKMDSLESYQRRSNLRIVGIKEGLETGVKATDAVAKLLKEILRLEEAPKLDRAHRGYRSPNAVSDSPRVMVVKFHYFEQREEVFQKAAKSSPVIFQGHRISIFPDYTASVAKKRAAFASAKKKLRSHPGYKFRLSYPATLRITLPSNEEKSFEDPSVAMKYICEDLKL